MLPLVAVVKPTDAREGYDIRVTGRAGLNWPRVRTVLVQAKVAAVLVIITAIVGQQPAGVGFAEDDDMVQQRARLNCPRAFARAGYGRPRPEAGKGPSRDQVGTKSAPSRH